MADPSTPLALPLPPGIDAEPFRAFAAIADAQLRAITDALPNLLVQRVDDVSPEVLTHLAWQLHLFGEGWELCATDAARRALVKQAIALHRTKGTPGAVTRVLAAIGHPDVGLTEGLPRLRHDRGGRRDGRERYDGRGRWARYRVHVPVGDTDTLTAADVARVGAAATAWAPARCRLDMVVAAPALAVARTGEPAVAAPLTARLAIRALRDPVHDGRRRRGDGTRYGAPRLAAGLTLRLAIAPARDVPASVSSSLPWDGGATRWDHGLTAWSL